jgi:hypothetical protein
MMLNRLRRTALASMMLSATLLLSGCLEPAPPATPPTSDTAARFLTMATFGPTQPDIQHLVDLGYEGWLTEQFNTAPTESHWAYQDRGGPVDCYFCASVDAWAVMESFWNQAILGKDQLRQRVSLALLELFVVSANTDAVLFHRSDALAGYLDLLAANAFGNYRTLLEQVTLNPTMGHYLSMLQNAKEDPNTGRLPDENYGREVMQLFTIGKWMLNSDGTRMKDANGQDIPTYGQDEVMGMARALTGWSWAGPDTSAVRWVGDLDNGVPTRDWVKPMQPYELTHRFGHAVQPPEHPTLCRDSVDQETDHKQPVACLRPTGVGRFHQQQERRARGHAIGDPSHLVRPRSVGWHSPDEPQLGQTA